MEIPMINRITDIQVGMGLTPLNNPSFLSQILSSLTEIETVSFAFNFCKWGAVILAMLATFGSLIKRVNVLFIRFRLGRHSLPSIPLLMTDDDYSSSDDEDDEIDEALSLPSSSDFEDEEDVAESSISGHWRQIDEDFRVRGSGHYVDNKWENNNAKLRRRRSIGDFLSLSEFVNGKSVVKLWDSIGFGLGLDFEDTDEKVVSVYDGDSGLSAVAAGANKKAHLTGTKSPAVIVSASAGNSGNLGLKIWDLRIRERIPAITADWAPHFEKIAGIVCGGVEKVYFRGQTGDDITVADMRKVKSPLVNVSERNMDTWWDADAVLVSNNESAF